MLFWLTEKRAITSAAVVEYPFTNSISDRYSTSIVFILYLPFFIIPFSPSFTLTPDLKCLRHSGFDMFMTFLVASERVSIDNFSSSHLLLAYTTMYSINLAVWRAKNDGCFFFFQCNVSIKFCEPKISSHTLRIFVISLSSIEIKITPSSVSKSLATFKRG